MALARFVVVEGPDLGTEFEIPMRGGGIGRGEGNAIQLSDLSVSRNHCAVELRDGKLTLTDAGSRNRTLVNGEPVTTHVLQEGDEVQVGKSRLAFLPDQAGLAIMRDSMHVRVTMEVGSAELLGVPGAVRELAGRPDADGRARRHLASLAGLGDTLRESDDRDALLRAACDAALSALVAERAFVLVRDAAGRMSPAAASVSPGDPDGTQLALPREVLDKVIAQGKAIAVDTSPGGRSRSAVAAPLAGPGGTTSGVLYADRRSGPPWDQVDLLAASCIAHLISAALAGHDSREVLARDNRELEDRLGGREFVGSSERAGVVLGFVTKVGPSDATVLLTGESGSGKEMVARAIHRASRRSRGPFVAVNCAALTHTLIESELFGHDKGAFTGATELKKGRFELADKGTLFLDEVGELPLDCQTKFLRVLEEQVFERVGGQRSIATDVRVVAATNRDLAEMVRRGGFREDLYYRLSVIHTVVPPLRERRDDIPELAEHFLARLRSQVARRISGFAPEAMRAMIAHDWPGNVRELKNAVERAIVLGDGELIRVHDLPPGIGAGAMRSPPTAPFANAPMPAMPAMPDAMPGAPADAGSAIAMPAMPAAPPPPATPRSLKDLEREGIVAALQATGGNKAQAAQILEIDRSTLYKKIKDYDIEV
jgi:DNA-binding NtrC family response regulator